MVDLPLACGPDCQLCLDKLCMQKVPIFADLAREDLETIARRILHRSVPRGSVILSAGDRADAITIVNTRQAKPPATQKTARSRSSTCSAKATFSANTAFFTTRAAPYHSRR